jgi:hypothetical protein
VICRSGYSARAPVNGAAAAASKIDAGNMCRRMARGTHHGRFGIGLSSDA